MRIGLSFTTCLKFAKHGGGDLLRGGDDVEQPMGVAAVSSPRLEPDRKHAGLDLLADFGVDLVRHAGPDRDAGGLLELALAADLGDGDAVRASAARPPDA